ncbi:hypothetical protein, partial [Streptomyces sp900116325]|uniref:hypothetical protein n=1 Tax=Streptomyces sp. 900116325 TaxID=3154295 RepID=UPI0033FBE767
MDDVAYAALGSESHHTDCGVTAFDIRTGRQLFHREDYVEELGEDCDPEARSGESVLFQPVHARAAERLVWLPVVREPQDGSDTAEVLGLDPRSGVKRWSCRLAPESS